MYDPAAWGLWLFARTLLIRSLETRMLLPERLQLDTPSYESFDESFARQKVSVKTTSLCKLTCGQNEVSCSADNPPASLNSPVEDIN